MNVKKAVRRIIPLLISLTLLLGECMTAFALWNGISATSGGMYRGHESLATGFGVDIVNVFQLEEGESPIMPLETFERTARGKEYTFRWKTW